MHTPSLITVSLLLLTACSATAPQSGDQPAASSSAMTRSSGAIPSSAQSSVSSIAKALSILDISRITKKPFGIHITKATSPVQPERFSGYHSGTDFEVLPGEDETTIPVPAICDGPVVFRQTVDGYGGLVIQRCTIADQEVTVLYGHIAIDSVAWKKGAQLKTGDVIAQLGKGYSAETDGERPHLHLGIHKGTAVTQLGYVQKETELGQWLDAAKVLPR